MDLFLNELNFVYKLKVINAYILFEQCLKKLEMEDLIYVDHLKSG